MPKMIRPRVLSWATDIDDKTADQAEKSANLPFIPGHIALMPDAHFGYGATVGSVIPTKGVIIPSAIGVDIGCVDADTEYLSPTGWRRISDYAAEGRGYDDDNFHRNVVPIMTCSSCGLKANMDTFRPLGTKYPEGKIV
jgi:hypothetical protein